MCEKVEGKIQPMPPCGGRCAAVSGRAEFLFSLHWVAGVMRISTRRFACRPAASEFDAMGWVIPMP